MLSQDASMDLTPAKFYALVKLVDTMREADGKVEVFEKMLDDRANELVQFSDTFRQAQAVMAHEHRRSTRHRTPTISSLLDKDPGMEEVTGDTFLDVGYNTTQLLQHVYDTMTDLTTGLRPGNFLLSKNRYENLADYGDIQKLLGEMQLNSVTLSKTVNALLQLNSAEDLLLSIAESIRDGMERYHRKLTHRHTVEGIKVHRDPIVTDIAMGVYANVDANGEIEDGKNPDELSQYTINKANLLASTIKEKAAAVLLFEPDMLIKFTIGCLRHAQGAVETLQDAFKLHIKETQGIIGGKAAQRKPMIGSLTHVMQSIMDLNPAEIVSKDKEKMMTREESFSLDFQNDTISQVAELLVDADAGPEDVIKYILERKAELRKFFHEENTFYVCKIGAGNPFGGEAPGALSVIPGERPLATLDEITGSGFSEVKDFIQSIEETSKFHSLFLATSPSKSADKANVLLIGPPGCLAKSSFVNYEVRRKDGTRVNHKGGSIERLWQRFNNKTKEHAGPQGEDRSTVDFFVPSIDEATGFVFQNRIVKVVKSGVKACHRLSVGTGDSLCVTDDHEFYVGEGRYVALRDLQVGDCVMGQSFPNARNNPTKVKGHRAEVLVRHHPRPDIPTKTVDGKYTYARIAKYRAIVEACMNALPTDEYVRRLNAGKIRGLKFLTGNQHVHHVDGDITNNDITNLRVVSTGQHNIEHKCGDRVKSFCKPQVVVEIESVGDIMTYDIQVEGPNRNFMSEGLVVHNCGKSEILRAVGGDTKSLGIFAQGSDFLTCWKGEAEKNPKRLFEEGLRLSKESKKRVHFLIDEIDSVLNDDRDMSGTTNLTMEFQILMDGVVMYPNLSVWGATNFPQRIPHAMMRRFNKVVIVGELTHKQRVKLLKQFIQGYLPTNIRQEAWENAAEELDGAVGDIIRKVGDYLWRDKIGTLVRTHPEIAGEVAASLVEDGKTFDLTEFGNDEKKKLKKKLRPYATVTSLDLTNAVAHLMGNLSIRQEIMTATQTYEQARRLVANLNLKGQAAEPEAPPENGKTAEAEAPENPIEAVSTAGADSARA